MYIVYACRCDVSNMIYNINVRDIRLLYSIVSDMSDIYSGQPDGRHCTDAASPPYADQSDG